MGAASCQTRSRGDAMTHASAAPTSVSRSRYLLIAAVAAVTQMLLMIPGYNENGDFQVGEWLIVLLISLVVSGALFIFVVPNGGAVSALVLGVVALVSVLVFWAGLTLPLAAAAVVIAWRARAAGDRPAMATAALALSVVAAISLVAIIIGDAVAN
jgi:hypothetical protein